MPSFPRRQSADARPGQPPPAAALRRRLREHPFLLLGIGSFAAFFALLLLEPPTGSRLFRGLLAAWQVIGFGPYTAANLLARFAPGLSGWLDAALVVVLGLPSYVAADAALARLRRRRPGTASAGA